MVRVGDTVNAKMHIDVDHEETKRGRVVYIHPKGRFATVEFSFSIGKIRECYPLNELT